MTPPAKKDCPWCGESILAVARKCKHCGEYLDENLRAEPRSGEHLDESQPTQPRGRGWTLRRGEWVCLEHGRSDCTTCTGKTAPVPRPAAAHDCPTCGERFPTGRDLYVHRSNRHRYRETPIASASTRSQPISRAGRKTDAGLACPKCGGTQFKPKRSGKAKLAAAPLAAAIPLLPKTQVKCVTCGATFKRG